MRVGRQTLIAGFIAILGVLFVFSHYPVGAVMSGAIFTSQIGFASVDEKFAVLAVPSGSVVEASFTVQDLAGNPVFTGAATGPNTSWVASNTLGDTYRLDFSSLKTAGTYRVVSNGLFSHPFAINDATYDVRVMESLAFFRVQDSGATVSWTALDGATGGHPPSHLDDARQGLKKDEGGGDPKLLEQPMPDGLPPHLDLTGGWYDAGDYNKYMGNTPWAAYNLLLAYEDSPAYWGFDQNGNGQADILDAAATGLAWMARMVWTDGSIFERVFNGYGEPFDGHPELETDGNPDTTRQSDDRPLDSDRWADITAKSSYTFAVAARIFPQPNPYLDLAQRTWAWAYQNQGTVKAQKYGGGLYFGDVEIGLTLGAIELLRSGVTSAAGVDLLGFVNGRISAHLAAGDWVDPSSWDFQRSYALERYYELGSADAALKGQLLAQMEARYRDRIARQRSNAYRVNDEWLFTSRRNTGFGQNDLAASSALDAVWIYRNSTAADRDSFRTYALNQIQWIWGRNPFAESWLVSNRATEYTRNLHFRVTARHPLNGVVVPGATDRDANRIPDYADDGAFYYSEPTVNQQALYIRTLALMHQVTSTVAPPDFPPTVSVESPTGGAVVSGTVTVVASATDDFGVASVNWQLDGGAARPMAQDPATGKWTVAWDTTQTTDGGHTVTVTAADTKGQTAQASVQVQVNNGTTPTLKVASMTVTVEEKGGSTTGKVQGKVVITVTDLNGAPVAEATVTGHWEGSASDAFRGATDASGVFVDWSNATDKVGTVTFTAVVDSVAKTGWVYDPTQSVTNATASKTY